MLEQFWEVRSVTTVILKARVKAVGRDEAKRKAAQGKMEIVSETTKLSATGAYDQWSPE
jgi:hypothetical protein